MSNNYSNNTGNNTSNSSRNSSSNRLNVPEARQAMDQFKMQSANEVGVNLKQGYNGDLSSREAGSVGGQMVNVMWHVRQTGFMRTCWESKGQVERVVYTYGLVV